MAEPGSYRQKQAAFPARLLSFLATAVISFAPVHTVAEPPDRFGGWRPALPGWTYEFPRDHRAHPEFRTEWWYFTGHLETRQGRRFGYQITFFRSGLIPPDRLAPERSRFLQGDLKFAHFAISDIESRRFYHAERRSRGAFGEAGFGDASPLAWIGPWKLDLVGEHSFRIEAEERDGKPPMSLRLNLVPVSNLVFHGSDGVSRKAEGEGNATHYYSIPRLASNGTLTLDDQTFEVSGLSWLDREWGSNLLAAHQVGWDWFSIQLEGGDCLMLFQIRDREGRPDSLSGTWIPAVGDPVPLAPAEIRLMAGRIWTSPITGGPYPVEWRIEIPPIGLALNAATPLDSQELALGPVNYWEGAIDLSGEIRGVPVRGRGYLEMTGYAGDIVGLSDQRAEEDIRR